MIGMVPAPAATLADAVCKEHRSLHYKYAVKLWHAIGASSKGAAGAIDAPGPKEFEGKEPRPIMA